MKKNLLEPSEAKVLSEIPGTNIPKGHKQNGIFSFAYPLKKAGQFWHMMGPGLTTGAADDDPSGIATYSQVGARTGFGLAWLASFTFPFMAIIQEMCARIGLVTGQGLAANIRHRYPRWVLYATATLLFLANSLNIGANLGAMAKATQLLVGNLDFNFLVVAFALVSLGLQIFVSYKNYARYLKWLALILLSYIFSAAFINFDSKQILTSAFVPDFSLLRQHIFLVCAVLGTTISPYLFFWQTSQEVEEEILGGNATIKQRQGVASKETIRRLRVDVWSGMLLSNLVMFFIIGTCAATLFQAGITDIQTADQAALALKPLAGNQAYLLFALGIIGTGLLAVPVLAGSASYAISESFGWREGLYRKLKSAHAFYGVIIASVVVGLATNFLGIDPIKALIYSAVANGLVAPIILAFILHISSSKKIMGQWANGPISKTLGWIILGCMSAVAIATLISFI